MPEDCAKLSLHTLPLQGQLLSAWLILYHHSDEHGVSRISQQDLASFLGIRHSKNVRKLVRGLEEAGMILSLPGNGRGHVSIFVMAYQRSHKVLMSILIDYLDLSEESAQNLLLRMKADSIAKSPDLEGDLSKGPLPAPSLGNKKPAHKGPLPEPPLLEPPLPEGPLYKGPLPRGNEASAEDHLEKGPAAKGTLQKGPSPAPPFRPKGPLQEPPFATDSLHEASSDRARVPTHARRRDFVVVDNESLYEFKQQQLQETRLDRDPARTREAEKDDREYSLQDAFRLAGIESPTKRRIPGVWKQATGNDLTPEDVLAWHFYREAENLHLSAERQLRPAYVISRLEKGERAEGRFYWLAREYLTELAVGDEEDVSAAMAPEIPALHRALEAFLPPLAEIGLDALDAMRAGLSDIARDLHACKVDAKTVADLHLYLTYTNQPIPLPQDVFQALEHAGTEFDSWRGRKLKAVELWRYIVQQLRLPTSTSISQAMQRASPLDLTDSLIVQAEPDLAIYFDRIWQRQGLSILSSANYPKELPIRFIKPKKATKVQELQ